MSTLHGILAELGIAPPETHPEREPHGSQWTVNEPFTPTPGLSYEIAYGKILFNGEEKHVIRRVRVTSRAPDTWIDLDAAKPLDKALQAYQVKAFRVIS